MDLYKVTAFSLYVFIHFGFSNGMNIAKHAKRKCRKNCEQILKDNK